MIRVTEGVLALAAFSFSGLVKAQATSEPSAAPSAGAASASQPTPEPARAAPPAPAPVPVPGTVPPPAPASEPAPTDPGTGALAPAPPPASPRRFAAPVALDTRLGVASAGTLGGARASAETDAATGEPEQPDDGQLGSHQAHFFATMGVRTTFVRNAGYDVFSKNDVLGQFSASFGRVVYTDGPLAVAGSLAWDYGGRSSTVRGASTSLAVHRITLCPELRYHFLRRLYGFGRVGSGVAVVASAFTDPVTAGERTREPVLFTLDASLGAAYEVIGVARGNSTQARGWLAVDAGYLFTTNTDLVYASDSSSPARASAIDLGELGLRGMSARVSVQLSF